MLFLVWPSLETCDKEWKVIFHGGKLFFMERWIAVVVVKDVEVEINHYFNLFWVKSGKEGIVEAVRAYGNVLV